MKKFFVLFLSVILLSLSVGCKKNTATGPAPQVLSTKIPYIVYDTNLGVRRLFIMNCDGTGNTKLSYTAEPFSVGNISLDSKIVYADWPNSASYSNLAVINIDGTGNTPVSGTSINATSPDINKSGTKILYMDWNIAGLFCINPDGTSNTTLVYSGYGWPKWSPDSSKIVYNPDWTAIWVVNNDGSNPHLACAQAATITASLAAWSPDGNKIVFTGNDVIESAYCIWTMNQDGSSLTKISDMGANRPGSVRWLSNNKIIFDMRNSVTGYMDIYIMDATGANVLNLTNTTSSTIQNYLDYSWWSW